MSQAQLLPTEHFSPSVILHHGRPATTSLEVAKFFSKRHDHVLRDIDTLLSQLPENSLQPNFGEMFQEQETPLGLKQIHIFILHRDGFMLLVMGYTGKKALAVKLAYIEAFNRLEAELAAQREAALLEVPHFISTPSTGAERRELHALVTREWCPRSGMHNYECWQKLNAHLGLKSIMDLPRERIGEAMSWVRAQIEGHVSPAPSGHAHLPVSKTDLCTLPVQASHLPKLHTLFKDIQRAAECLALSENWTHLAVRFELGDAAAPAAKHAVDMHVNAAWYALGLARSSLLAAVAVGKPALA